MYQQLQVSSSPVTVAVDRGTQLQVLTQNVRMRNDGVAPTSSVGYQIAKDSTYTHPGGPAELILIAESETAEVNIMRGN